jgi:hypothetical protein
MYRQLKSACIMVAIGCMSLAGCNFGGDSDPGTPAKDSASAPAGTASSSQGQSSGSTFMPNFDGLYYTEKVTDNTRYFVRYFKDAAMACEVGTAPSATADDVRVWLKPDSGKTKENCGPYNTATGDFATTTVAMATDGSEQQYNIEYEVLKLGGGQIVLQPTSGIPGYEGTKSPRTFTFSRD